MRSLARSPRPPRFSGKKGELLPIVAPANLPLSRIVLAGLGKPDAGRCPGCEELGGALAAHLERRRRERGDGRRRHSAKRRRSAPPRRRPISPLARGCAPIASTSTAPRRSPSRNPRSTRLTIVTELPARRSAPIGRSRRPSEAVFFTRDLVSEPANVIYPETLAEQARSLEELGVEVEVLDEKAMRKLGMGALLGVGAGQRPPAAPRRHAMEAAPAQEPARRSPSSARASPSTPAASRSSRPPAWGT